MNVKTDCETDGSFNSTNPELARYPEIISPLLKQQHYTRPGKRHRRQSSHASHHKHDTITAEHSRLRYHLELRRIQQGACVCTGYDSEESHNFYIHKVAGAATASMIKVVLYFLVYILDALIYSLNVSLQLI